MLAGATGPPIWISGQPEMLCIQETGMKNAEKITNFLSGRKPHPFCDQCIADALQFGSRIFGPKSDHYNRNIAQQNCVALSQTRQFRRASGVCHQCAEHRLVTWAK